jgi:hypothetical protein
LEGEYNKIVMAQRMEEGGQEDEEEETPRRNSNMNEGEPAKAKSSTGVLDWFIDNNKLVNEISGW